jgi:hypothetical protein
VEGFELNALQGALQTIENDTPTISVAIYHKPNDPVDIPLFLMKRLKNYEFFIGHHSQWFLESMLYCVPRR